MPFNHVYIEPGKTIDIAVHVQTENGEYPVYNIKLKLDDDLDYITQEVKDLQITSTNHIPFYIAHSAP